MCLGLYFYFVYRVLLSREAVPSKSTLRTYCQEAFELVVGYRFKEKKGNPNTNVNNIFHRENTEVLLYLNLKCYISTTMFVTNTNLLKFR